MKKYKVVLSYDVQKTFVVEAEDEDSATDKARDWKGDTGKDNWEYRDLIENEEINLGLPPTDEPTPIREDE